MSDVPSDYSTDTATLRAIARTQAPVKQQAAAAATSSLDANPAQAGDAWKLSAELGASPDLIYQDVKGFQQWADEQRASAAIEQSPPLQSWLAKSPFAALIGAGEFPTLAEFADTTSASALTQGTGIDLSSYTGSLVRGWKHHEYQTHAAAYMLGQESDDALKSYERDQEDHPPPQGFLESLGQFLGAGAANVVAGLPVAGAGAAAGAVAGPGALAGAGAGLAYGIAADVAYTTMGETYRQQDLARDNYGKPLPEATKQISSVAAGLAAGMIARIVPEQLFEPLKGAISSFVGEAMVRAAADPGVAGTLGKVGTELAKAGLSGAALNAAFNLATALPQEAAKSLSGQPFETIFNDPAARRRAIDNFVQSVVDGAALFSVMAVPGIGAHPVIDAIRIRQARDNAAAADAAFASGENLATRQAAPELLRDLVREGNKGDVGIPSAIVDQVRQEKPDAFGYVESLDQQLNQARPVGGDITIPAADYFTQTRPEVHALVKDDLRVQPEAMTRAEADDLEKNPPAYRPEAEAEPGKATTIGADGQPAAEPVPAVPHGVETVAAVQTAQQAAVRDSLFLHPLFEGGKALGMSEADFTRYSKLIQDVQDQLNERTYQSARREEARRQTAAWKGNAAVMREQVVADFAARRDIRVDRGLREREAGRVNMDPETVGRLMNDPKYAESLDRRFFGKQDRGHPDEIAELYGYPNGVAMLHDLRLLHEDRARRGETPRQQYTRLIETETRQRMEDAHGKLEQNIQQAALDAVLNSKQIDLLHEEVKALAGMAKLAEGPLSREEMVLANRERFARLDLARALRVGEWQRLVGRHGLEAERALLKGDAAAAFNAKQAQFSATVMLQEARDFAKETAATEKLIRSYQVKKLRSSRDPEYAAQIHGLLASLDLPLARNRDELRNALAGRSLDQFYRDKTENEGIVLVDPAILPIERNPDKWTVTDWRALSDVLTSLDTAGREANKATVAGKKVEKAEILAQIKTQLELHGERWVPDNADNPGFAARIRKNMRAVDAMNIRMERLFDWIDQRDPTGILNRAVLQPLYAAQHWKADQMLKVGRDLKRLGAGISQDRMNEAIDNPTLREFGRSEPRRLTRENVIVMALNMGTRSNWDKLTRGMGWNPQTARDLVLRTLDEGEWKYVEGIWKLFSDYFPLRDDIVRRTTGIGMDPVETDRFKTPYGWKTGGYYPIIWDQNRKPARAAGGGVEINPNGMFPGNPNWSTLPARGSTIARIDQAAHPVSLSLRGTLSSRLNEMLHDIAFREPLIQATKLLVNSSFRDTLKQNYGPEYADQVIPWLKNISGGISQDDSGVGWMTDMLSTARLNQQALLIGFNPKTGIIHGISALFNSMHEALSVAGIKAAPQVVWTMATQWGKTRDFVLENSPEVRNRLQYLDAELNRIVDSHLGDWTLRDKLMYYAHWHIAFLDQMSAVPVWKVAYDHYIGMEQSEADAAFAADKVVRNAHGSSGIVSQPAILRMSNGELMKWHTMFMGYFNHNYNQLRDLGRLSIDDVKTGPSKFVRLLSGTMAYLLMPAIIHEILYQGPPQQNQSWGAWTAEALAGQVGGTLPFVRNLVHAFISGRAVEMSPLSQFGNYFWESGQDVAHLVEGKSSPRNWVSHTVSTLGAVGVPGGTNQVGRDLQFLWDLHSGRQHAETVPQWLSGLIYGHSNPAPRKH